MTTTNSQHSLSNTSVTGYTPSYYAATAIPFAPSPALAGQDNADVCVIGGGYTGLSAALHLAEQGLKVILLEAEKVGWGASGRNGGHVGVGQRVGQLTLEKKLGLEKSKQLWDLGLEAVDLVRHLIDEHQIGCDLKEGILHVAAKAGDVEHLKLESERLRNHYGYEKIRFVEKAEVDSMVGSKKFHAGQLDLGSLHLHPLNFTLGLAAAARKAGVKIYQQSRVTHYETGQGVRVHTNAGSVNAKHLVLGCNGYLDKLEPKIATKIMPINNFVLATEPLSEQLARSLIRDDVAVQDSLFVINYWKLSADKRLIFGGGENYSSKFPSDLKSFVRKYMLHVYPQLEDVRIDYAWGGTLAITMNRMPHFGQLSPNIYFAQGYSGHGVATACFAGKLIAEAISGKPERLNLFASLPVPGFPGGTLLRWPALVAGMLFYSLRDKL
ncbi:MAG: FAD-binding oxidoreductase [Pseudomonadales bacterium]